MMSGRKRRDQVRGKAMRMRIAVVVVLMGIVSGRSVGQEKAKAITLSGTVVDAAGKPVAGAEVIAYRMTFDLKIEPHLVGRSATKADGVFSFRAVKGEQKGLYIVVARKRGLALGWVNGWMHRDYSFRIVLGKPMSLGGRVTDPEGKAISGARVRATLIMRKPGVRLALYLYGWGSLDWLTAKTDAAGKFSFPNVPAGARGVLLVTAPGRARTIVPADQDRADPQPAAGRTDIEVKLAPEAKITGRVVEKKTGKGVNGVKLVAYRGYRPDPRSAQLFVSTANGAFTVVALAKGRYVIRLAPEKGRLAQWIAEPAKVDVESGKTASGVKVQLVKGDLLEVTITEKKSKTPVVGAGVLLRSVDRKGPGVDEGVLGAETGKDGVARFRLLPGRYRLSYVHKDGYASDWGGSDETTVAVTEGGTHKMAATIRELARVRGVVHDRAGKPVAGAVVQPVGAWSLSMGMGPNQTDKLGRFEMPWDPEESDEGKERILLVIRHPQRQLAAAVKMPDDLKPKITLGPGVQLSGRVVDEKHNPIVKANITITIEVKNGSSELAREELITTDKAGRFVLKALPAGCRYTLHVRADKYGSASREVKTPAQAKPMQLNDLVLPLANLSVAGIVVDDNGKPVKGATVRVRPREDDIFAGPEEATTDNAGKFTIKGLPKGKVSIRARDRGGELSGRESADAGDKNVKIVIRKGDGPGPEKAKAVTLSGTVVDAAGKPVAGAEVIAYRVAFHYGVRKIEPNLLGNSATKADGTFSFRAVKGEQEGIYMVVARKPGLALGWVNGRMGRDHSFRIVLGKPMSLGGRVTDPDGKAISGARVRATLLLRRPGVRAVLFGWNSLDWLAVKTDAAGKFEFTNVPAGARGGLLVTAPGRASSLVAAGQTDVEVKLAPEARITGRVVEKKTGKGIKGIRLAISAVRFEVFPPTMPVSGADGSFAAAALAKGRYTIRAVRRRGQLPQWTAKSVEVVVESGKTASGVKVELVKGGLLEVAVREKKAKRPIVGGGVSLRSLDQKGRGVYEGLHEAVTGKDGVARFRLLPGRYAVTSVRKDGYVMDRRDFDEKAVTVTDGGTHKMAATIRELVRVGGVVHDRAGKPVAGAEVQMVGAWRISTGMGLNLTDKLGHFEVPWDPEADEEDKEQILLVVRYPQRQLAAAVKMPKDLKPRITLGPGVELSGRVVDEKHQPIVKADIDIMIEVKSGSSSLSTEGSTATGKDGRFVLKALPAGCRYTTASQAARSKSPPPTQSTCR